MLLTLLVELSYLHEMGISVSMLLCIPLYEYFKAPGLSIMVLIAQIGPRVMFRPSTLDSQGKAICLSIHAVCLYPHAMYDGEKKCIFFVSPS